MTQYTYLSILLTAAVWGIDSFWLGAFWPQAIGTELDFPSAIVFFIELWEENVIVGKANGVGTTKCRNLPKNRDFQRHMHAVYKCIYTLTIVTSNAVLCTNVFYCTGYWCERIPRTPSAYGPETMHKSGYK